MDSKEILISKFQKLSKNQQDEVMNFIDLISSSNIEVNLFGENQDWSKFSLLQIMKEVEDEPDLYSQQDIKFKF